VSVPSATEFAPIVSATLLTSAEPLIENEPVTSPVANVTVLEELHCPAAPAFVAVVALPANVVAVIMLLPIVMPEPVESCVFPEAVLRTVPTSYLVAVEASVLTLAAELAIEAVPLKLRAVNVPDEDANERPAATNCEAPTAAMSKL
jgi:hypothetical protein